MIVLTRFRWKTLLEYLVVAYFLGVCNCGNESNDLISTGAISYICILTMYANNDFNETTA